MAVNVGQEVTFNEGFAGVTLSFAFGWSVRVMRTKCHSGHRFSFFIPNVYRRFSRIDTQVVTNRHSQ